MTLKIPPDLAVRRLSIQKYIYLAKKQLVGALLSNSPERIRKAKLTLARHLLELAESPELGPTPAFRYSHDLTILIKHFQAGGLDWGICEQLSPSYRATAVYLISTITFADAEEPADGVPVTQFLSVGTE